MTQDFSVTLKGQRIGTDEDGYLCLTDMWRLSGQPEWKKPAQWERLPYTKELAAALSEKVGLSHLLYTKRGRTGGTYAHVILALAYAEYLSPELGIEVREIALRVYAGDVTVLDAFNRARREKLEDDANRVMTRDEIRRNNHDLNHLLKTIGAKNATHWASFHNEGYKGLYGGLDENNIHARKGLRKNERILDHMGFDELAANMFRTSSAQQHLRRHPVEGVKRACHVHGRMGTRIREFLAEEDLAMPEDLPRVDSIKDCQKRLKATK